MSLNELRDKALSIAQSKGFNDATIGEDIALMHSELSEALEAYRSGAGVNIISYEETATGIIHEYQVKDHGIPLFKPAGVPSELADTIIRILHFCGKHRIDIDRAVAEKMTYNETREFRHGGKLL